MGRRGVRPDIPTQLERLIRAGGKPVKVGEISAGQLAAIKRVVPGQAGLMFEAADGSIYATEGLLNSLRIERPKHAERLVAGMPEHLKYGEVRGNPRADRSHRPIIIRPGPLNRKGEATFDVLVLDATQKPKSIGVPSIYTAPERMSEKWKKP